MYFPYLRGRQYELIAIRELLDQSLISERIIPVIEPVKLSSPLIKTLTTFQKANRPFGLICNPQVGGFVKDLGNAENAKNRDKLQQLLSARSYIPFLFVTDTITTSCEKIVQSGIGKNEVATICLKQDAIRLYEKEFSAVTPRYNFMPDESAFRRRLPKSRVLFEDRFAKRDRNVDYMDDDDEFFSSDHIYYSQDGYVGFSDYSVIGDEYSETGFAPYAVAIHIVYFDSEQNIRVKHFVSETNDDITDPAGKFAEALSKLVVWNRTKKLDTYAIRAFEQMYEAGSYPGLGTVKKLAIMHHIELISRYLDGVAEK